MKNINNTFQPQPNDSINSIAWVSYKGSTARNVYLQGFVDAADQLLNTALEEESVTADTTVYPICFLIRHAIELWLKNYLISLEECKCEEWGKFEKVSDCLKKVTCTHEIDELWRCFKNIADQWDARFSQLLILAEPVVKDIVDIDNSGQVFRYSVSNQGSEHLAEHENIGLNSLKINFNKLKDYLQQIDVIFNKLIFECSFPSRPYTRHLSRDDLIDIAKILPKKNEWDSEQFATKKTEIKKQYKIGSKEFTLALDKIQGIWEAASVIGMLPNGKDPIDYDSLILFFKIHNEYHPNIEANYLRSLENNGIIAEITFSPDEEKVVWNCGSFDPRKDEKQKKVQINMQNRTGIFSKLDEFNITQIAQLSALYYFMRTPGIRYSEEYDYLYKTNLCEYNIASDAKTLTIEHLLRKPDLKICVNRSLNILKQVEIK
ncbi:hypothetical protein [Nitrosomonas sp.]|uniref:hypothetical protein n=1 Tax=Nitrosomonas sp. TaxID=42353 RepID=UPI002730770A|nr:hypothetical protein [Nitrosomonas sp.]MDP2225180.1 hypothetical protein [Nitrosomonas sp.]